MAANPSWTSAVQTSQTAQNARLNVDGIDIISSSNKVEGAITGTTLDLYGLTPSNEISFSRFFT
jgi:flagellar hook-associated protein 2